MRKALLVSAGVVLLALAVWWLLGGDEGARSPVNEGDTRAAVQPSRPRSGFADDEGSLGAGAPGGGARTSESNVLDGGDAGGAATTADGNELAAAMRAFTDSAVRGRLQQNAARAKAEVDRFCELNDTVKKAPVFDEKPHTKDAAIFMASRVDWEGSGSDPPRLGSLHLATPLREKLRANAFFLSTVTDDDLRGLDFSWLKQLLAFDVWTFGGDGSGEELRYAAMVAAIPNFVVLQQWVKLRFARALRDGDWNDAVLEVRHLAYLTHTMSIAVSDAIAVSLFKLELRAREQAEQLGVAPTVFPPPPDVSVLDAQRETAVKAGWFVAPGVDKETREKALRCTALPCTMLVEGMTLHSSLRTWADPAELDAFVDATKGFSQCDTSMTRRLMKMPPATLDDLHWLLDQEDGPLLSSPDGGR